MHLQKSPTLDAVLFTIPDKAKTELRTWTDPDGVAKLSPPILSANHEGTAPLK